MYGKLSVEVSGEVLGELSGEVRIGSLSKMSNMINMSKVRSGQVR